MLRAGLTGLILASVIIIGFTAYTAQNPSADNEKLYMDKCSACHSRDGSGSTARGRALKAPDLRSDAVQNKTDAQLIELTLNTKGHPASLVRPLGEEGARKTVMFMRTLKSR